AGRIFFGSASLKLAHEAHCTVRVARARREGPARPSRVIIGVDGSKGSEEAVNAVASRHWPENSEARIVNACWRIPTATSESLLSQIAGQIAGWIAEEHARVKVAIDEEWGGSRGFLPAACHPPSPRAPTVRSKSSASPKPDRLNPRYQSNRLNSVTRSNPPWRRAAHIPQRPLRDKSAQSPLQFAFESAIAFKRREFRFRSELLDC